MFKKQNRKEDHKCPDPFADKVKCEECRCLLDKADAYKIRTYFGYEYYCQSHKKPYTKMHFSSFPSVQIKYYNEVEVNEQGVPVGYKKI